MPNQNDERQRILRWLSHGARLAEEYYGERATHANAVWLLIAEAVDIIDRTPDQEKRWLTAGARSGGWNMVGISRAEADAIERLRIMSAMKPGDGQRKVPPQRFDEERAMDVMSWLRFCTQDGNGRLQAAAVALARGGDTEVLHRIYGGSRKRSRQLAYDIKTRVCGKILRGLRETFNIVPADKLKFAERLS